MGKRPHRAAVRAAKPTGLKHSRANLHLASYDYPAVGAPPGSSAFKGRSRRPSAS